MEDKWKLVQFVIVSSLLCEGKPMTNYENFQPLHEFLKLQLIPRNSSLMGLVGKLQNTYEIKF
jgi:hypothetical protein